MTPILAVFVAGTRELLRSRVYLNLLAGGFLLVFGAWVFAELAPDQADEILIDVGLAFLSLMTAVLAGVLGIVTVTRDIETREVHSVVARPVPRATFVVGRFLTLAALVLVSNLVLGLVLSGLLLTVGADGAGRLWFAAQFASGEGIIVAAVAVMFGVASSSTTSALFVGGTFLLSRLLPTFAALIESDRFGALGSQVATVMYTVLPQLFRFDLSAWVRGETAADPAAWAMSLLYAAVYVGAMLALATLRFARRELR